MVTHNVATGILLAVLALGCCRAQQGVFVESFSVEIAIGSNNRTNAILPDETTMIQVEAETPVELLMISPPDSVSADSMCDGDTCTFMFEDGMLGLGGEETITIVFRNTEDINQTLTLTIRESLNATCAEYTVPLNFTSDTDRFTFNCNPRLLRSNRTDNTAQSPEVQVIWRKFRLEDELRVFLFNRTETSTSNITNDSTFTVSASGTVLTVKNSGPANVLYYYLPTFLVDGVEHLVAETLIFMGPSIMDEEPEFSIERTFGTGAASNLTDIRCETDTYPPATVSWRLVNEEYPCEDEGECGVDVRDLLNLTDFTLVNSGSNQGFDLTYNAIIQMLNLRYEDDGLFTCTADNGLHLRTRRFRLRVKSPLRPLWPALGILGVIIFVSLIMLCSFSVEKVVERKRLQGFRSATSSPNHTDQDPRSSVSSSGGQSNNRRSHDAVKRRSSSKPLIDESTL